MSLDNLIKDKAISIAIQSFNDGYSQGAITERDRIINLAESRICFDHAKGCEHGACHALTDLVEIIKIAQKK